MDGVAVPEDLRVQVLEHLLVGVLVREGTGSRLSRDEADGADVGNSLNLGLQALCLASREALVHKGQKLVLALQVLQLGVGVHRHQGKGPHDDEARHRHADGGEGHEAMAEHIPQPLPQEVAETMITHGCALPHSRLPGPG